MLLFCFLDDRIVSPTSVCLFFVDENSYPLLKQQFTELVRFGNSWLDVTTHSKTQALILHWLTVNFIGRGWSGKLEASFWGVKMSESILFSYNTFLHIIEIPKQQKPCWPYRHFKGRSCTTRALLLRVPEVCLWAELWVQQTGRLVSRSSWELVSCSGSQWHRIHFKHKWPNRPVSPEHTSKAIVCLW